MVLLYDRNKRRSYELARFIAAKLVECPSLIEHGRAYLERHVRPCPNQSRYYELWSKVLSLEPGEIAERLTADDAEGDLLRDTRPVFYVLTNEERAAVFAKARRSIS